MDIQHGHGHTVHCTAWTVDMPHEHGDAAWAWTCTCSLDMDTDIDYVLLDWCVRQ